MPKLVFNEQTKQYEAIYDIPEEKETTEQKLAEVIPYQDQIKIRRSYVGLPVANTSTGLKGFQGQLFLIGTGTLRLAVYLNGALRTINLS